MKYKVKHLIEYGFMRLFAGLFRLLPYRLALAMAWVLARIAFHVVRFRRREALARMREVFGDLYTKRQYHRFAWDSCRNFFFTAVDVICVDKVLSRHLPKFEAMEAMMRKIITPERGAIIACPHMGSWELSAGAVVRKGFMIFAIAGRQRNPLFDQFLNEIRGGAGNDILMRGDNILRTVIRRLRSGNILAVLPDIRMPTPGLTIDFLGKKANIGQGIALFAHLAGVPIVPIINTRKGWTDIICTVHEPIWPDKSLEKEQDAQRMTQAIFDLIDKAIRRDPGQWFWYNKRWILEPVKPIQHPEKKDF